VKEWGYRKIDTLSVSCDATAKKGKSVLPWLESKVTLRSSVIGTKETTAQVHPRLMTKKLAQLSEQKGVKIHVGTATRIELDSDGKPRELVVQSSGGVEERLPTDCLVIAAGAWSGRLAKSLLGPKGHRIAVDGHRAHSIVVKSDELTPHAIFTQIRLAHGTGEFRALFTGTRLGLIPPMV
jgi:glycine/D-amino acid oxidase-like deaminating enzyme